MGSIFCDLHVSLKITSSGDTNSTNLPCLTYVLQVVKSDLGNSSLKKLVLYLPDMLCVFQRKYLYNLILNFLIHLSFKFQLAKCCKFGFCKLILRLIISSYISKSSIYIFIVIIFYYFKVLCHLFKKLHRVSFCPSPHYFCPLS